MHRDLSLSIPLLLGIYFVGFSPMPSRVNDTPAFVSGVVTDRQTGEPILAVNVIVLGTRVGQSTDSTGRFFIGPLPEGRCIIEFSHVSFEQRRDTLTLHAGDTLQYDVSLVKRPILLEEVKITAETSPSAHLWKGIGGRVLLRKDIEGTGIHRFADLLRHISPGVSMRELGSDLFIDLNKSSRRTTRPTARDYLQNTNPLIYLNGMKIGKSPLGLNMLIKPEEIDQIVVLKGIDAEMYGYEGRDGVILVDTTPQPDTSGLSLFQRALYVSAALSAAVLLAYLLF
jgi:hypothetical protein